jgi:muramidase (phage lysozyme)
MKPSQALMLTAAASLLVMSHTSARGAVEAADGDMGTLDAETLTDSLTTMLNRITEQPAGVDDGTAARNLAAALEVIKLAEGTNRGADPYRVCFGFAHTIRDLSEHPAITGEWRGAALSDEMCRNAGFGPGCKSTAAGAFQLIRPTWVRCRDALGLADFSPASQDAACIYLIQQRGALQDVYAGRVQAWVNKCRAEWASLPGNYAKQGQRSMATLMAWFQQRGGVLA